MPEVLKQLDSDDFIASLAFIGTPTAMRRALACGDEVLSVRKALLRGEITEELLRSFVSELICNFQRGEHFAHELALAAIAVAIESRMTDFTEEFLLDLARLKLSELPLAIRVARECLAARVSLARNRRIAYVAAPFAGTVSRVRVNCDQPIARPVGNSTTYRFEVA